MKEFRVLGKSLVRKDGFEKVTGQAIYAGDVKLPGMLVGKILRSPYSQALIRRILSEEIKKDGGIILNPNFTDYKLVRSQDIPLISVGFVETDDPYGPFGAKGLGESAIVPIAPAIANAI